MDGAEGKVREVLRGKIAQHCGYVRRVTIPMRLSPLSTIGADSRATHRESSRCGVRGELESMTVEHELRDRDSAVFAGVVVITTGCVLRLVGEGQPE